MWLRRSLSKGLEYIEHNTKINIIRVNDQGFSIFLYPNYPDQKNNIQISLCFIDDKVIFADLIGNGERSGHQDKKYGTLLTNLTIQILNTWFEGRPFTAYGTLSNRGDIHDLDGCHSRRKHFWESFGFELKSPESFDSPMSTSSGNLKIVDRGHVNQHISTTLSISSFHRYFNRPIVPLKVKNCILSLEEFDFQTNDIPAIDSISLLEDKAWWWGNKISMLLCLILYCFICAIVFNYFGYEILFSSLFGLLVPLFFLNNEIRYRLKKIIPHSRSAGALLRERNHLIDDLNRKINALEAENSGLVWRAYHSLSLHDPSIKNVDFDTVSESSKSLFFGRCAYISYGLLIAELKKLLRSDYELPSRKTGVSHDFLFGEVKEGFSLLTLTGILSLLGEGLLKRHLNRLLRECNNNHLVICDSSSYPSDFTELVNAISDDVACVELYSSSEPYNQTNLLQIKFYLSEGVLDFRGALNAWKFMRAEELITAIKCLFVNALIGKTFILEDRTGWGYKEKVLVPSDPREFVLEILDLINERWVDEDGVNELTSIISRPVRVIN